MKHFCFEDGASNMDFFGFASMEMANLFVLLIQFTILDNFSLTLYGCKKESEHLKSFNTTNKNQG